MENSTSFLHPILQGYPKIESWIQQLRDDYKTLLSNNTPQKRSAYKLKYGTISLSFPELNCWKQGTKSKMEPLSSSVIRLVTGNNSEADFSALDCLRIPCLNIEEIRNIVGGGSLSVQIGDGQITDAIRDDIITNVVCENGYRKCFGLPLRYGHVQKVSTNHATDNEIIEDAVKQWYEKRALFCNQILEQIKGD